MEEKYPKIRIKESWAGVSGLAGCSGVQRKEWNIGKEIREAWLGVVMKSDVLHIPCHVHHRAFVMVEVPAN